MPKRQRQAARVIAAAAHDVDDCRMLLDMLGLDHDVVARRAQGDPPARGAAPRRRSRAA